MDRLPPHNIEAEKQVIGSILIDNDSYYKISGMLDASDFYLSTHKSLYDIIAKSLELGKLVDMVILNNVLKEKGIEIQVGTLTDIVASVTSSSSIINYADIVKKKSTLRKVIESAYDIGEMGFDEDSDIDEVIDKVERKVLSISKGSGVKNFKPLVHTVGEVVDKIKKFYNEEDSMLYTGFKELDNHLSGMQKSDLIILAARPSLGKSALAMDIARHVATSYHASVGIFSLEMSKGQVVDRMLSSASGVDLWRLRTGRLSIKNGDLINLRQSTRSLSSAPIYIEDNLSSSIVQMKSMARKLQAEKGLGLLVVDYLQLIQPTNSNASTVQQITEISRALKEIARELDIPVLALSQLSRAVEQRHPMIPKLSDLRDSGSIEQDADVVLFISRDPYSDNDTSEILISKHRNGPVGKVKLKFMKEIASFRNLE